MTACGQLTQWIDGPAATLLIFCQEQISHSDTEGRKSVTTDVLEPSTEEDRSHGSGLIQSVIMTTQIIEALAAAGQPMRLTALANHLGEPKARMHRHLSTLKHLGYVDQDAQTECYKLGLKLAHMGQAAMEQFDLRRLAEPYMMKLRDLSGQTTVLSIPASGDAIVSAACEFPNPVMISVRLGYRLPAHASAQGRLTLAFSSPDLQQRVLARKLAAYTPRTSTDAAKLRDRLAPLRTQLYEISMDETLLGISALAAPILDFHNELVGTIAVVGTTQYVHEPVDPQQLFYLRGCAKAISLKLNSTGYETLGLPNLREFIFD
jgi:IclR family KDG regulon transcriptional repressor